MELIYQENPSPPPFAKGRKEYIPLLTKGDGGGLEQFYYPPLDGGGLGWG